MEQNILIRNAEERDYPFILRVNKENVEVLSPMDEDKLKFFVDNAELVQVVEVPDTHEPAAFMIALREGCRDYTSENYIWFSRNYDKFLYVDRIVIDEPFRGMGLGKAIYENVFNHAHATGVDIVTAEIDTIPYNEQSLKFHEALGFREVGEQVIRSGEIKVSLQVRDIEKAAESCN